jgi:hypothetical protein
MINPKSRRSGTRGPHRSTGFVGCRPVGRSQRDDGCLGCRLASGNRRDDGIVVVNDRVRLGQGQAPVRDQAIARTGFYRLLFRFQEATGTHREDTELRRVRIVGGPMSEAGGHDPVVALTSTSQRPDEQGRSKRRFTIPGSGTTVNGRRRIFSDSGLRATA